MRITRKNSKSNIATVKYYDRVFSNIESIRKFVSRKIQNDNARFIQIDDLLDDILVVGEEESNILLRFGELSTDFSKNPTFFDLSISRSDGYIKDVGKYDLGTNFSQSYDNPFSYTYQYNYGDFPDIGCGFGAVISKDKVLLSSSFENEGVVLFSIPITQQESILQTFFTFFYYSPFSYPINFSGNYNYSKSDNKLYITNGILGSPSGNVLTYTLLPNNTYYNIFNDYGIAFKKIWYKDGEDILSIQLPKHSSSNFSLLRAIRYFEDQSDKFFITARNNFFVYNFSGVNYTITEPTYIEKVTTSGNVTVLEEIKRFDDLYTSNSFRRLWRDPRIFNYSISTLLDSQKIVYDVYYKDQSHKKSYVEYLNTSIDSTNKFRNYNINIYGKDELLFSKQNCTMTPLFNVTSQQAQTWLNSGYYNQSGWNEFVLFRFTPIFSDIIQPIKSYESKNFSCLLFSHSVLSSIDTNETLTNIYWNISYPSDIINSSNTNWKVAIKKCFYTMNFYLLVNGNLHKLKFKNQDDDEVDTQLNLQYGIAYLSTTQSQQGDYIYTGNYKNNQAVSCGYDIITGDDLQTVDTFVDRIYMSSNDQFFFVVFDVYDYKINTKFIVNTTLNTFYSKFMDSSFQYNDLKTPINRVLLLFNKSGNLIREKYIKDIVTKNYRCNGSVIV